MSDKQEALPDLPGFLRRAVERAIDSIEHPTGLHLNDGKERPALPGGTLRRMLLVIDAQGSALAQLWQAAADQQERITRQESEIAALREAIGIVCEGWTLPDGVRKVLETALWSAPAAAQDDKDATIAALREQVEALKAIPEEIAQQWEGCEYDGMQDEPDIGKCIRMAGERLVKDALAAGQAAPPRQDEGEIPRR